MRRLLRKYPRLQSMLEWEGEAPVGGRPYNPGCPDPSEAGAMGSCLWDLTLLRQHYHPHVAQVSSQAAHCLLGGICEVEGHTRFVRRGVGKAG